MKKNKTSIDFLKENLAIIMVVLGFTMAWANLNNRVAVNAKEVSDVRDLVERVIVLEEHDKNIVDDIREIKVDLKDIKNFLNVK